MTTSKPILWCCHVIGPDDVVATSSYLEAATLSHVLNERFLRVARLGWSENDPNLWAVPAPWPHDDASHERDLANPSQEYVRSLEMARVTIANASFLEGGTKQ